MRRAAARAAFAGTFFVCVTASAQAPPARAPACAAPVTTCGGESGYYVAADDREKLEKQLDALLKELRTCLDAAGGKHVTPAIIIRFDADGKPMTSKVDAGGYDSLPCVAAVSGKLGNARSIRETFVRCEYGCPKPKPPPPSPPPVVAPVPPTGGATAPPTTGEPQTVQPAPAPSPAPAPAPSPAPAKRTEKVWYGWQNLVVDAGALTTLAVGIGTQSSSVNVLGGIAYVFGSPVVHWVHRNVGPGFGSMAMRIFLPPLGLGVGALAGLIAGAGDSSNDIGDVGSAVFVGAITGVLVGTAIPIALDAAVLGYEKVEVENVEAAARRPARPTFTMAPTLDVRKNGGTMGVGGTF